MFQRFGMEFILFLVAFGGIFLLFERLQKSRLFGKVVKGAAPVPDSDDEVLEAVVQADNTAEQRAVANETEAAAKSASAAKLRARRTPPAK